MKLDRGARGLWLQLAVLGAGCWLGFALVYVVTVRTLGGRQFADASLRGATLTGSGTGDLVDRWLGVVSLASLLGAVAVVALVALVRLRRDLGLAAIGLLVAANVSTRLLKSLVLQRPDLGLLESTPATLNSLPSGHTTAAFSVVVALLFVVPGRLRGTVAAAGGAYACLTALATMAAGWHRAADSVAAFLLVGGWAAIAGAVVVAVAASVPDDATTATGTVTGIVVVTDVHRYRPRWSAVFAGLSLVTALALLGALVSAAWLRESWVGPAVAFLAGALFIVGTATVVLVGVLSVMPRIAGGQPVDDVAG